MRPNILTPAILTGVDPISWTPHCQPEDMARCALFLASDDARHIIGEIIDVNGGLFMD